jgi:NAD(P)-dependent dehydrogenase (short-subunit alcohol dehydrogenase family)
MKPTYDFHDRVAVITGAGSGMGLATAQAFAESESAVVLADRNEQTLQTATAELTSAGRQALGVLCDRASKSEATSNHLHGPQ